MQRVDVRDAHALVDLVDGLALITPSSTTCAPSGAMKRPSEVPPPVESFGRVPVTAAHRRADRIRKRARRRVERLARDVPLERVAHAVLAQDLLDGLLEPSWVCTGE